MEYKKSIIILLLTIFLFSIASVCASDVNNTVVASEDTQAIELSQNEEMTTTDESQKTIQTNDTEMLTANDEETTATQNNLDTLSLEEKTYADLSNAVGSGGDINLQPAYYKYNGESDTITITNTGIINGNGAIIDMAGSTIQAFYVIASRVTIKNLTIKNANYDGNGGAIYFENSGSRVINCNFINNTATMGGGAIRTTVGSVENCNFINNTASRSGGAIIFTHTGTVTNCKFTDNAALSVGGAIYFGYWYKDTSKEVKNCNFTGNNATAGSAIYYFNDSKTKTVSNSRFLNNRANVEDLQVTKNDNNITITFTGKDNLLNAIYSDDEVSFTNVTYWSANGIANTDSSSPVRSNRESGQNITVGIVVNYNLILNEVKVTDENGTIVLDISVGENYYISARHDTDSYYTETDRQISSMTVNVTSQTTNNKTVNITAKSNIYSEVMPGKLLFILPNNIEINATYASNGTWWAVHTFDDYADYQVNASYIGLDNVTITNATISIVKANSTVNVSDVVLTYGESKEVTVTTTGATGITAKIDNDQVSVIDNYTIPISGLNAGNYTLTVTTIPDGDHDPATKTVNITVNKAGTEITLTNETLYLKAGDMVSDIANLTPTDAGNLTFQSSNEDIAIAYEGTIWARVKGNVTVTVSFAGNDNYAPAVNKTITVYITPKDASVSVENETLDLNVDDKYEFNPTVNPSFLAVEYSSSNVSVVTVTDYGLVRAVGEGTAIITLTVGNDQTYAINTTNVTVTVSKVPTEISLANATVDLYVLDEIGSGATLTPADAGNLTYASGNESVAIVKDGKIIAVGAGQAIITVSFAGDDKYSKADDKTVTVTVNLKNASVSVNNSTLDLFVGDNFTIVATTSPDGLNVTFVPDNSGVYSVDDKGVVTALKEGTGNILVKVGGDGVYAENSTTVAVTVRKIPTEIVSSAVSTVYNIAKNLIVTLNDAFEKPISGANITVDLNGAKTYTTDENGQVKVSTKGLAPKTYTANIIFNGNDKYKQSTKDVKVTVKKATPKITANTKTFKTTTKTKKYTITLKDNKGKAIKKATVYLKVGGKTYKAVTNSKGKATFKITKLNKKGTFKATVTYKGNKYYNKATKKSKIKVITTFKTVSKGSKDKTTVKEIQRALKNNGYYLTAYGHYLMVDGIYHDYTVKAVKQFQKAKGLKVTGKVDEKTAKKLKII